MECNPNQTPASYSGAIKEPAVNITTKVTLGSSWEDVLNDLSEWDQSLRNQLRADIEANSALRTAFNQAANKEELAEGWKFMKEQPALRNDVSIVKAAAKMVKNNATFVAENNAKLSKIMDNLGLAGAACRTCAANYQNLVKPYMKYMDEYIEDLDFAITAFGNNPEKNFIKLINEMAGSFKKADGGSFMLHVLKSKGTGFASQVAKFEDIYLAEELFEADIKLLSNGNESLWEFKSFIPESWNIFTGGNQLKAYIRSGKSFEYLANKTKLINGNIGNPLEFVKQQFQRIFKTNNYKLYDDIVSEAPNAFIQFGISNKGDFVQKVNNIASDLYNFVKVE